MLFSQQPKHTVHVPAMVPASNPPRPTDVRYLIEYMRGNLLSEREEMFCEGDSV